MAKPLVPDDLSAVLEPLLPPMKPRPKGGRPPVPNRAALTGIIFVLKTGIPWEDLPAEMGCGSGEPEECGVQWQRWDGGAGIGVGRGIAPEPDKGALDRLGT